ncbi:sensor histidine kinase [Limisalsivibrio acetivorans]|uniref:sensor histidine kinase n=1 Tax=Limisalsivibrio acetivorans TaxID=1304888 RepID=UPI0003B6B93B|nr:ATP-binding protein [Limisalsivibrio acetivorans]
MPKGSSLKKILFVNYSVLAAVVAVVFIAGYGFHIHSFDRHLKKIAYEAMLLLDENVGFYREFLSPRNRYVRNNLVAEHAAYQQTIIESGIPDNATLGIIKSELESEFNTSVEVNLISGEGVIFKTTYPLELGFDLSKLVNASVSLRNVKQSGEISLDYPIYERKGGILRAYTMSYIPELDIYFQIALFLADLNDVENRMERNVLSTDYITDVAAYMVYEEVSGENVEYHIIGSAGDDGGGEEYRTSIEESIRTGDVVEGTYMNGVHTFFMAANVEDSGDYIVNHRLVYRMGFDMKDEWYFGYASLLLRLTTVSLIILTFVVVYRTFSKRFSKPFEGVVRAVKNSEEVPPEVLSQCEKELAGLAEVYNSELAKMNELISVAESYNEELETRVRAEIDRRKANESILITQARLATAGEIISSIAHQWKKPLGILDVFLEDIGRYIDEPELGEERIVQISDSCMNQVLKMSSTIEDFRKFFAPSDRKVIFSLKDSLQQVLNLLAPYYAVFGIRIEFRCNLGGGEHMGKVSEINENLFFSCDIGGADCVNMCGNRDQMVYGYPNELKQVFLGILDNAKEAVLEHAENGLLDLSRRGGLITLSIESQGDKVAVNIEDNGGGIPSSFLGRVFEPYFTTKPGANRTGIGLYMAKTLLETGMNGTIHVSNSEKGAVLTVILNKFQ